MRFKILFILLVFASVSGIAQKKAKFTKVLGMPEHFKNPKDFEGEAFQSYLVQKSNYDKIIPWVVYSDRNNNLTYESANESAAIQSQINFREVYYVVEDQGSWIRLAKVGAALENGTLKIRDGSFVEDKGWIQKTKVILWGKPLEMWRMVFI